MKSELMAGMSCSSHPNYRYNWAMDVSNQALTTIRPKEDADRESQLQALLAQIRANDDAALGQLYDITAARVYGLAIKMCGDNMLAEEVTCDVFTQVWQQAGRYSVERGKVITWLLTICRSRAIDALRRADKSQTHPDPMDLAQSEVGVDAEPLNLLQMVERDSAVHTAIKQLSNDQQQLLSLAYFKGLSHQQIADFTGLPLGTVKTQLRNAQKCLRDQLSAQLGATPFVSEEGV